MCLKRNREIWVYWLFPAPIAVKQTGLVDIPHSEGWRMSTMMRSKWANDNILAIYGACVGYFEKRILVNYARGTQVACRCVLQQLFSISP